METTIDVKEELRGNVRVSIDVGKETLVFVWRMTVDQARREAEEIAQRMERK